MDLFCDLNRIAITEARLWWFFNGVCDEGGQRKPGTVTGILTPLGKDIIAVA